jgi:hypothetical protein
MPAAVAIPSVIGSVVSGIIGNNAAQDAGKVQQQAANTASQQILDTTAAVNPGITSAASTAGTGVTDATTAAAKGVTTAATDAGTGATTAAGNANDLLQPYIAGGADASGTLRTDLASGGQLNRTFTQQDMEQNDPGYQFRIDQANLALARSEAARGGGLGGGAAKALDAQTQGLASSETANAFGRYEQQNNDLFSRLNSVANSGQAASTTAGGNLISTAEYAGSTGLKGAEDAGSFGVQGAEYAGDKNYSAATTTASNTIGAASKSGDYLTGGAAAKAAADVGGANAITGAISGGANAIQGGLTLRSLLQNPALMAGANVTMNPGGGVAIRPRVPGNAGGGY